MESSEERRAADGRPPRIAYLMSRFPKITETFVLYEILELLRRGFQIEIWPLLREPAKVRHPEIELLADRLHYTPFLSLALLRSNARELLRSPGR